jgi:hypothetical protein
MCAGKTVVADNAELNLEEKDLSYYDRYFDSIFGNPCSCRQMQYYPDILCVIR